MAAKKFSTEGWGSYPQTCVWCGAKLYITKDTLWFHSEPKGKWTAHASCIKEHGLPVLT